MRITNHQWLGLLIALGLVSACTPSERASETPPAPTAVTGLKAILEDEVRPYTRDGVEYLKWQTFWVVHWDSVPAAKNYEIALLTAEGMSRKTKTIDKPPYRLEVAVGDNPKAQGLLARETSLQTIQGLLSIRIAARYADAPAGPPSPWLVVGRVYPEPK